MNRVAGTVYLYWSEPPGEQDWVDLGKIDDPVESAAVVWESSNTNSYYTYITFDLNEVPVNAKVVGIEITFQARFTSPTINGETASLKFIYIYDGSEGVLGESKYGPNWPTGNWSNQTFGGSQDVWGVDASYLEPPLSESLGLLMQIGKGGNTDTSYIRALNYNVFFATPPQTDIQGITGITSTTMNVEVSVNDDGTNGDGLVSNGVCWATHPEPTIADSHITRHDVQGVLFETTLTGLAPDTTYYIRPYAINDYFTSYGVDKIGTTLTAPVSGSPSYDSETQTHVTLRTGGSYDQRGADTDVSIEGSMHITGRNQGSYDEIGQDILASGSEHITGRTVGEYGVDHVADEVDGATFITGRTEGSYGTSGTTDTIEFTARGATITTNRTEADFGDKPTG